MDDTLDFILDPETQLVTIDDDSPTISVLWDRAVQEAVINTALGPTIGSRAYGMLHTAMFDAWAAYEDIPVSTQLHDGLQRPQTENTEANKTEAMSHAAYRVLLDLFPTQKEIFADLMSELGFDPNNLTTDTTTAAGIGNVTATTLLQFRHNDGSNQLGDNSNGDGTVYSDITGYTPVNPTGDPLDIAKWTPEFIPIDPEPNSDPAVQTFLTPQWGDVTPFALSSGGEFRPSAPQPFLLVDGEVDLAAGTITLADDSVVNISRDIIGTIINPEFIEQVEEVIAFSAGLTDEQKLIAEFWEDPGGTSFPPGTWMTFGQFVSARDEHTLDEDVRMFFALGNAVFDAGVATWESKVFYDYTRPVRAIRELGELGLIGEFNADLGGYAIEAWGGEGLGTQTILAKDFLTYQTPGSHPSPPFAEYTSGHSAFSAAGAEVLKLFTGSDEFGGSVTFEAGESRFESGITPSEAVTLEWETFSEAADEAGLSRLYGGIHFEEGDVNGRDLGVEVGQAVYDKAQFYVTGAGVNPAARLAQAGDDSGIFTFDGLGASNLTFKTSSNDAAYTNELGLFIVDDEQGNIGNLAPGADGYLEAALARSQVIFSTLAYTPSGFDVSSISRVLGEFDPGARLGFYLVANGSTDELLDDLAAGATDLDVLLSTNNHAQISEIDNGSFSLAWEDQPNGDNDYNDLVVEIHTTVESVVAGSNLQSNGQKELIDLSSSEDPLQVNINVYRDAIYDNFIGLYRLADDDGSVLDPITNTIISPTAQNRQSYVEAALANRVEGLDLSVENNSTATISWELEGGATYAPFIIADGNLNDLGDNFEKAYFPFLDLNSDGSDRIRLIGSHVFAFEDLDPNSGDFNDVIIEVNLI